MASTHFRIGLVTILLLVMIAMEEFKPVLAKPKERGKLKQRTKALEKSVKEMNDMIKEQAEKIKEQEQKMKQQEDKMKEQEQKMNEQGEKIKQQGECEACSKLKELSQTLNVLQGSIDNKPSKTKPAAGKDCAELYKSGHHNSGVYTIDPDGSGSFDVFCDQTSVGGGWTVFQKRQDASVDFNRGWADYKQGFGDADGNFWAGLDNIHRLTNSGNFKLRVDLEDFEGKSAYAEYDLFGVASEEEKYKLSLGSYSGTAGDSLSYHKNYAFTTKDRDNDLNGKNCAVEYDGGWWFVNCMDSNLNGLYNQGEYSNAIKWNNFSKKSAKTAEMKIRPLNF